MADVTTYITDDSSAIIPDVLPTYGWEDYDNLLTATELSLRRIFNESGIADNDAESAQAAAGTALSASSATLETLRSTLTQTQYHTDQLAAQVLPVTGGQYTHLIAEDFSDTTVQDTTSSYDSLPLDIAAPIAGAPASCPAGISLEVDKVSKILRLKREGYAPLLSGLPEVSSGITVEKVYGTRAWPTSPGDESGKWFLRVAGPQAINSSASSDWLPASYEGGVAVRLRASLKSPSAATHLRLRGALQDSNGQTRLLETVVAVDSRTDVRNPTSPPTRAISVNGSFSSLTNWTNLTTNLSAPVLIPTTSETRAAGVSLQGVIGQQITSIPQGGHAILRYRTYCPFDSTRSPANTWSASAGGSGSQDPSPAALTYVRVYYYGSVNANPGSDSALGYETFRDAVPFQGGLYDGIAKYSHLLTIPDGTKALWLIVGSDPLATQNLSAYQSGARTAYADVWITDEAITRQNSVGLPQPAEAGLAGPGDLTAFIADGAVDALTVSLGNDKGGLVLSDVWITLGQNVPKFAQASDWKYELEERQRSAAPPPYALSLPAESPNARASRDPLLLYQARYAGSGPSAPDVSQQRLGGTVPVHVDRKVKLCASNGLPSKALVRTVSSVHQPKLPKRLGSQDLLLSDLTSRWGGIFSALLSLAKMRGRPLTRAHRDFQLALPEEPAVTAGTLYVYELGLTQISLLRQEYAPHGLYVTDPLQSLDSSGIAGEIREISIMSDPPLVQLDGRVQYWISPSGQNPALDTAAQTLTRAVPLDSQRPRATFHSAAESLAGLPPATSDICTALGLPPPAFYIQPSLRTQLVDGDLSPDDIVSGIRLEHVPYVNREAIFKIARSISGADQANPTVYDPNAVRPVIDFLSAFDAGFQPGSGVRLYGDDSSPHVIPNTLNSVVLPFRDAEGTLISVPADLTQYTITLPAGWSALNDGSGSLSVEFTSPAAEGDYTYTAQLQILGNAYNCTVKFNVKLPVGDSLAYVTGYPPIAVRLKLPTGKTVLPDSLGKPRPGEVVFEPQEVLQESMDIQVRNLPASPEIYTFTTPDTTADSLRTQQVNYRSFVTQNRPIASGDQGAALELYWHKSIETSATTGVNTRFDVKIPPSSYEVNAHTGQITVFAQQPHNLPEYDQIIARYFWRVGDVAVREWFPPPSLYDLMPQDGEDGFTGSGVDNRPDTAAAILTGSTSLSINSLMVNPILDNKGEGWKTYNSINWNSGGNNPYGGDSLQCSDSEGIYQDIDYRGPGTYKMHVSSEGWGGGDSGGNCEVRLQVFEPPYSEASVVESYGWIPIHFIHTPKLWPDDQTFFTAADIQNAESAFVTDLDPTSLKPLKMRFEMQEKSNRFNNGNYFYKLDLAGDFVVPTYGYPEGYDHNGKKVALTGTSDVTIQVSGGQQAGIVYPVSPADLLNGPIQQGYPVTRNVTNYSSDEPAALRKSNFDPESPNYYPVFEYRVDPGGIVRFADDFSTAGIFSGTKILIQYEYLDINPRLIVRMLPRGQTPLDPPSLEDDSFVLPQVSTPEIKSLQVLVNARY